MQNNILCLKLLHSTVEINWSLGYKALIALMGLEDVTGGMLVLAKPDVDPHSPTTSTCTLPQHMSGSAPRGDRSPSLTPATAETLLKLQRPVGVTRVSLIKPRQVNPGKTRTS